MALTKVSRGLLSTSIVDNGNATAITIDSSENVGIGTSSPSRPLQITDATNDGTGGVKIASYLPTLEMDDISGGGTSFILQQDGTSTLFKHDATERMRIDSAGNVGIGTSSPSNDLHISSTSGTKALFERTGSTGAYIGLKDSSGSVVYLGDNNGTFEVQTAGSSYSTKLAVTSAGNVGIGTSSPPAPLSLGVNANASDIMIDVGNTKYSSLNSSGESKIRFGWYNHAAANIAAYKQTANRTGFKFYTELGFNVENLVLTIDSDGNLLLSTTSVDDTNGAQIANHYDFPKTGIEMKSNSALAHFAMTFRNTNGLVGNIATTGSATSYNTSSDQRLKENIADADDAGSKVDAIQVRKFDWIADGSHQDYGMIAQELQAVAPEAVSGDADSDEMMGVDYSKLVPMLVKEIQSLRARVAQLEA